MFAYGSKIIVVLHTSHLCSSKQKKGEGGGVSVGEELNNMNISRSLLPKKAALVPLDESCHMTTLRWKVAKGKGA